ncbi:MAG: hypothetical protein ACOYMU_07725 [Phycisphaerales bacterium]
MTQAFAKSMLKKTAFSVAVLGFSFGCGTERSVNVSDNSTSLSHASNNINEEDAWSMDGSALEERWDEDPTIMQPNYPYNGFQPGFSE